MDSIFKFKKAKKMVGEFDSDDPHEWCLLRKPQIGDVTLFVHFHKLWLVTESPEIMEDEENGIEGQEAVTRIPVCHVYFGFLKEGKFIVERQNQFQERLDELANKRFLHNLQRYLDEGYVKDYSNYNGDIPIIPDYHGHKQTTISGNGSRPSTPTLGTNGPKMLHKILKMRPQSNIQAKAALNQPTNPSVTPTI